MNSAEDMIIEMANIVYANRQLRQENAILKAELEERDLMIKSMRGDNVAYRECIRRMEQRCENFVNYIAKNGWNV